MDLRIVTLPCLLSTMVAMAACIRRASGREIRPGIGAGAFARRVRGEPDGAASDARAGGLRAAARRDAFTDLPSYLGRGEAGDRDLSKPRRGREAIARSIARLRVRCRRQPSELRSMLETQGSALFVSTFRGYFHESISSRNDLAAVFVEPKHVVVLPSLGTQISAMSPCRSADIEAFEIRVTDLPGRDGRHIGHLRVVRANVLEPITIAMPPSPPSSRISGCSQIVRYRIEDHFIDLSAGEHRWVLTQVFEEAASTPPSPLPGVPFDAYRITQEGIEEGDCSWYWDD